MPKELVKLAIASLDELDRLNSLQHLIRISLEQFDNRSEETLDRVDVLLSLYRFHSEVHLRDLALHLDGIRQQVKPEATSPPQQLELPTSE